MSRTDTIQTPLGPLYIVFEGRRLLSLSFTVKPAIKISRAPDNIRTELIEYFRGERTIFTVEITLADCTPFERSVWHALREIPYGETRSYKWVAKQVGRPNSARAVGQALSKNPVPVVLPCHRVIESGGHLGGYSEGESIKVRLLEMEYYNKLGAERVT